jgi:hypothetical protein
MIKSTMRVARQPGMGTPSAGNTLASERDECDLSALRGRSSARREEGHKLLSLGYVCHLRF